MFAEGILKGGGGSAASYDCNTVHAWFKLFFYEGFWREPVTNIMIIINIDSLSGTLQ